MTNQVTGFFERPKKSTEAMSNVSLKIEQFADGEYEVPVFMDEEGNSKIIGVGFVTVDDGELSATIDIDHEVFQSLGFSLTFVENNDPIKGRRYTLVAKRSS